MKIKPSKKRPIKHVSKGFALIATITLMMLLALLSVGLLTIASSQVRISEKQLFAAEAKSLARFSWKFPGTAPVRAGTRPARFRQLRHSFFRHQRRKLSLHPGLLEQLGHLAQQEQFLGHEHCFHLRYGQKLHVPPLADFRPRPAQAQYPGSRKKTFWGKGPVPTAVPAVSACWAPAP